MTVAWPLRIYYDAGCPLCAQEMDALACNDVFARLDLVDCSAPDFQDSLLDEAGISATQAMDFIHARDADGRWLKGVAVFEAAYSAIGVHAIARLLAYRGLRPFWDWLYPRIASKRRSLSRLGLNRLFGRLVSMAARRAAKRAIACDAGVRDTGACDRAAAGRPGA